MSDTRSIIHREMRLSPERTGRIARRRVSDDEAFARAAGRLIIVVRCRFAGVVKFAAMGHQRKGWESAVARIDLLLRSSTLVRS